MDYKHPQRHPRLGAPPVTFFAADGTEVIYPVPARFFEVPIALPRPEGLNYIP